MKKSLFTDEIMVELGKMREVGIEKTKAFITNTICKHCFENEEFRRKMLNLIEEQNTYYRLYKKVFDLKSAIEIGRLTRTRL